MRTRIPGLLLLLGGLLAIAGMFGGLANFIESISPAGQPWRTPGSVDLELTQGRWVLYQQAGLGVSKPAIPPRQVAVLGPAGPLALTCLSCGTSSESMTFNGTRYLGVVSFEVPDPGSYKVTVTTPGQSVVVSPSVWRSILALFGGIGLTLVGGSLSLLALIWLVVAGIRARHDP